MSLNNGKIIFHMSAVHFGERIKICFFLQENQQVPVFLNVVTLIIHTQRLYHHSSWLINTKKQFITTHCWLVISHHFHHTTWHFSVLHVTIYHLNHCRYSHWNDAGKYYQAKVIEWITAIPTLESLYALLVIFPLCCKLYTVNTTAL